MTPAECRWLLRAASLLVPPGARGDWLAQREADLWYCGLEARRAGKSDAHVRIAQFRRAWVAFPDALWRRFDRERVRTVISHGLRTPQFCLLTLCFVLLCVAVASDGLARTRRIMNGAGFPPGERVVSICIQELLMGRRQGVTPAAIRKWTTETKSLDQLAAYVFVQPWYANGFLLHRGPPPATFPHALVTPKFFDVLGLKARSGRLFNAADAGTCADCIVITQHLKRDLLGVSDSQVGRTVDYDGRRWRIIGELPDGFWFMTQKLGGISLMDAAAANGRVVGLGLLREGVSADAAQSELRRVVRLPSVEVVSLSKRLQAPLRSLGFGSLGLLTVIAIVSGAAILRAPSVWRFWAFFFAKTALAMVAVLLVAIDYGGAGQLSVTGGNQPSEPVAFWMWMVGTVLCVWWSIADQKMRCRTCQRRFTMPVRIGSPDRVLFEHEATEMVCPGGHGTLYVEGMTETFRQEGRWKKLDESWRDLFAGKR